MEPPIASPPAGAETVVEPGVVRLPEPAARGEAELPQAGERDTLRRWLWLALGATLAALAGGFAVLVVTFEEGTFAALDRLGLPLTLALVGLVAAAWAAAAARLVLLTRALAHPLPPRRAVLTALAAEFGSSASPAGVGGVAVRVGLLRSYGVPLAESAAVAGADFAAEMTSGVLIGLGILLVALFRADSRAVLAEMVRGEATRQAALPLLAALAVLAAVGLALRWWLGRPRRRGRGAATAGVGAARGAAKRPRRVSLRRRLAGLARRSRGALERVRTRLAVLRHHPHTLALCLLLAAAQIVARYSVLPLLVWAFTGESSPFLLFLVQGTVMAISQILVAPGGGGSVELGAGALLLAFLPAHLTGIAVLLWRLFTYHLNLLVGGLAFFTWLGGRGRKKVVEKVRRRRA